jgi:hypothetical protein
MEINPSELICLEYLSISHIAAFLSVVLIAEMLEICIQTSYDQNVQLILKSYLPVVYGTPLNYSFTRTSLLCSDLLNFNIYPSVH